MKRLVLLCLLVGLFSLPSFGQVSVGEKGKLSGLFFGDYYWIANHHNQDLDGRNGFWIRRIYLTYDYKISDSFSSRLRLEMEHDGDFQGNSELVPTVKDAYLKWKSGDHQILAGISSTPTFNLTEAVWAYRSVAKSPLDLYDFGSSRDLGLSFIGELGEAEKFNYHFFFGNGNGESAEFNEGKKVMLALGYDLTKHFIIEVYGDWNDGTTADTYTLQGFIGYRSDVFNFGALYARQWRQIIGTDLNLDLVSIFANKQLTEKAAGFLRVDHMFDPYPDGDDNAFLPFSPEAESTFLVGGVDVKLHETIHLMPNIETIFYGENALGETPETDVIPRVTLFFEF
ncbi:MAG TPA: hypothetical protein VFG39_05820 [Balneolaceae bacterium]|nr:hypothetical protein [Balneolaceae bacterium]